MDVKRGFNFQTLSLNLNLELYPSIFESCTDLGSEA